MVVSKAIIGASYDNSGNLEQVLQKTETQAINERLKSGRSQHNLYRSVDDQNTSKFNYSLKGIPLIAYSLMNFYHSDIERVALIGNTTTYKIFDSFVNYFDVNKSEKRFVFVHEGNEWSLKNTIYKGKSGVEADDDESLIFCSGDLPLGVNINQFVKDKDLENYDAVLNLNSLKKIYDFDQNNFNRVNGSVIGPYRRWHLPVKDNSIPSQKDVHWIKENNLWTFNVDDSLLQIINIGYSGRKQYDDNPGEKKVRGGRWNAIKELVLKDGKWLDVLKYSPKVFPYLLIRKMTSYNPCLINFDTLSDLASISLERKVKIKATHSDFGFLNDIDSAEDIVFNELMMKSVDPSRIYAHWGQLNDFGNHLRSEDIPIVNQFPRYFNELFNKFSQLRDNQIFDGGSCLRESDLTKGMHENVEFVLNHSGLAK